MYRVYMPLPDPLETEHLREWSANAPWRLAGMAVMLASCIATTSLYIYLAKMAFAAFSV
jgi:hypothetical protein